jgi:hypothetical protein
MKWRTVKLTILSFFLLSIGFLFLIAVAPRKPYVLREFFNPNKIIVNASDEINIKYIDIYWFAEHGKPMKVYSKGRELNVSYKEYGFNHFDILYKGDTLLSFYYFKTNNWHGHRHNITLTRDSITVEIKGPDKEGIYSSELRTEHE